MGRVAYSVWLFGVNFVDGIVMSQNSLRRKGRADRLERFLVRLIEREGADVGHGWRVRFLLWNLRQLSLLYRVMVSEPFRRYRMII